MLCHGLDPVYIMFCTSVYDDRVSVLFLLKEAHIKLYKLVRAMTHTAGQSFFKCSICRTTFAGQLLPISTGDHAVLIIICLNLLGSSSDFIMAIASSSLLHFHRKLKSALLLMRTEK